MRKVKIFFTYLFMIFSIFLQNKVSASTVCIYSDEVGINVIHTISADHIHYEYELQTSKKIIVNSLIIGEAINQPPIQIIPENTPLKIYAAAGYRGLVVFEEEGFYQTLVWQRHDQSDQLGGAFGVNLPTNRNQINGIYSDGKPVSAANFEKLHFRVISKAGKTYCGFTNAINL